MEGLIENPPKLLSTNGRRILTEVEVVGDAFAGNLTSVFAKSSDDGRSLKLLITSEEELTDELMLRALTQFIAVELHGPTTPLQVEDQTEVWKRRAFKFARKCGAVEDAEEIACEVVCKFLSGQGLHQTVEQAVLDIIHKDYGEIGSEKNEFRKAERKYYLPLDEVFDHANNQEERLQWKQRIEGLKSTDRAIMILRYLWGLQLKEIGHCFGVGESRVNQIIKKIVKQLRDEMGDK